MSVPPPPVPVAPPYCTVIETRTPKMKMHKTLGHAKNALMGYPDRPRDFKESGRYITRADGKRSYDSRVRGGQLWQWDAVEGAWSVLFDVPAGTWRSEVPWRAS